MSDAPDKLDPPYNTGKDLVYPDNCAESLEAFRALRPEIQFSTV